MAREEPRVKVTEEIRDTPIRLAVDGTANIGIVIVAPVGPRLAYITSPDEFLANYTVDGVTIPRDADISFINGYYMSFFSGLVVARSMNTNAVGGLRIYFNKNSASLSAVKTYFNNEVELTRKYQFAFSINSVAQGTIPGLDDEETPSDEVQATNWGFIFNSVLYYAGNLASVQAGLKAANQGKNIDFTPLTSIACDEMSDGSDYDPIPELIANINSAGTFVAQQVVSGIEVYCDQYTTLTLNQLEVVNSDGVSEIVDVTPYNVTVGEASMSDLTSSVLGDLIATIACNVPQSVGVNPYTISMNNFRSMRGHVIFDLTIDDYTYVASFDPEATDASDLSCYLENLNTVDGIEFQFTVVKPVTDAEAANFGDGISNTTFGESFYDETKSTEVSYKKAALSELEDQEQYQISYLAPCGETRVSFIKAYTAMGIRNKWFTPVDVPYDRTNENSIQQYGDNVDDDYNVYMCGPFDKNTGLTGWTNYIAASTLYYEQVMSNRAANSEFAPVFDAETGVMQYTNPVKLLKKSQREALLSLSKPINYVIYDQATGTYYMNDNWTHYTLSDNVMGEECNVRMVHKISRDLERVYAQFKAKHNTEQTRRMVNNVTTLYFNQNIMNQNYRPAEFRCVCDTTNNTDDIIRGRKLAILVQVRLYNSIKWIDVINAVYSVGGTEFEV